MTVCEAMGAWAAGLSASDLPQSVAARARLQERSIRAGAAAGEADAATIARVAPEGPLGEIYRGAAASMAHDWDDYLYMGHTGHSAVWAADAFTSSDDDRLVAQVAANEVAGRLGAALLLGPHNGQFWSSIHCASGAIAAGVGLGLDGERLAHALAIAYYQPPFGLWPGFMGPPTKLLTAADPAMQGARAALLAAEGLDGPLDVIEHPRGLLRQLAFEPRPRMLGALGRVWLTDTIAFKPHPGCAYLQPAVDAALRADVRAEEVERIEVDAGIVTTAMERLGEEAGWTPVGITFSVARSVAVVLVAGRLTHEELRPAWLAEHADALEPLARRVRLRHDWDATLATAAGMAAGGASIRDVPASALPRVARRAREAGMTELRPLLRDLPGLLRRGDLRGRLAAVAREQSPGGIENLDPARLRMTFPCRLRITTRDGAVVEIDGEEPGAAGHPLAEQEAVIAAKEAAVGLTEAPAPA